MWSFSCTCWVNLIHGVRVVEFVVLNFFPSRSASGIGSVRGAHIHFRQSVLVFTCGPGTLGRWVFIPGWFFFHLGYGNDDRCGVGGARGVSHLYG